MLRQLGTGEIIDRECPSREVAPLTQGQVIDILVANRLSTPRPLWRGAAARFLNDDRLGRALDAIFPHVDTLQRSVAWAL